VPGGSAYLGPLEVGRGQFNLSRVKEGGAQERRLNGEELSGGYHAASTTPFQRRRSVRGWGALKKVRKGNLLEARTKKKERPVRGGTKVGNLNTKKPYEVAMKGSGVITLSKEKPIPDRQNERRRKRNKKGKKKKNYEGATGGGPVVRDTTSWPKN